MAHNFQTKFLLLVEESRDVLLPEVFARLQSLRQKLAVHMIELLPQPFFSTAQPQGWWQEWIESQYGQAQLKRWLDHPSTFWLYVSSSLQNDNLNGIVILGRQYPAELTTEARDFLQSVSASRVLHLSLNQATLARQTDGSTIMPFDNLPAIIRQFEGRSATNPTAASRRISASREETSNQSGGTRYRSWPPDAGGVKSSESAPEFDPSALKAVLPAASKSGEIGIPVELWSEVKLGVSTPSELSPGDEFVARFAAYTPDFKAEVERIFKEEAPSSRPRLDLESSRWKKGARVTVSLRATQVQIDNPVQTFEWNAEQNILRFDAKVLPEASGKVLILKFDIAVEGLSLLSLRPEIQLSATPGSALPPCVLTERPAPRTAFASYAHADKVEVFNRISSVISFTHIDFFTDDVSIIPGEQWKARLENEIKNRDVFLLFWSRHAQESTYVDWEWRTAWAAKREILPQALEPADVAPPPEELSDLQFGGVYERLIASLRKP
jgi:hypothetical protein